MNIPARLQKPLLWLVLAYRRARYGYAFRRIPLTRGKFALVDPEDYDRLSRIKWHAHQKTPRPIRRTQLPRLNRH